MKTVYLVCSYGFSDVLTLGRQNRPDPYATHIAPSPWLQLLPPAQRIAVHGRLDAQGIEVEPLDIQAAMAALQALPHPPSHVAISLLFAQRNAAHEHALSQAISQRWPATEVLCSSGIAPIDGEYERTVALLERFGLAVPPAAENTAALSHASESLLALQLEAIANRMQQRLVHDAVSTVVREAMDCAAAIFLPDGRMIAQARTLPLLLGSLSPAVAGMLQAFPLSSLNAGDGVVMNDPWHGGTHLPDFTLLMPLYVDGRIQALLACVLHHQDVGGITPGSVPTHACSVLQEGLRIPPIKLYRNQQVDTPTMRLLCANSRMPDNLAGDLQAQWNCLSQGAHELSALIASTPQFGHACQQLLQATEQRTRAALASAADGDYVFNDALDGDGISKTPVMLSVRLIKRGDTLTIDLRDCAAQTLGPINASAGAVQASVSYFARMLAQQPITNDGCTAPLTVLRRPGTIVDPQFPAAINARTNLVKLLANALMGAWAKAAPDNTPAPHAGQAVVLSLGGQWPDGRPWMFTEIIASAAGGSPWADGASGMSTDVGNARSTPAESIEQQAPIRMEQVAVRLGSGGAGKHHGGHGVIRAYRLLHGSGSISYRGERHQTAPQGAGGGLPGQCATARIERADGTIEHLAAKAHAQWQCGDRLVIETAGAGGWGCPP